MDTTLDRDGLGAFLRARREALQPEDVGLRRSARRRTSGLRREEVAELFDMPPTTSPASNAAADPNCHSRWSPPSPAACA